MAFVDFHVHTTVSDGMVEAEEVLKLAESCGIGVLAITDHNETPNLAPLQEKHPNLRLVQGCEFSCKYLNRKGEEKELHIVGLGFDPEHPLIREVLRKNQPNRRPYVEAILEKLRGLNIHIGSYEELVSQYPKSRHVGRTHIAMKMHELGYVQSTDEAFDEYIGGFGKRRAYVDNPLHYVSPEECVTAIRAAGGVAVLAHLYYYCLEEGEQRSLLRRFKELAGDRGAMETDYAAYDGEQRKALRLLAEEYDLIPSAASDFHGKHPGETLAHGYREENFRPLLRALSILPESHKAEGMREEG